MLDQSSAVNAHQINNGGGSPVDPHLAAWHQQNGVGAYPMHQAMPNAHPIDAQHSFDMQGVQYNFGNHLPQALPAEPEARKKGSSSSATNDKELREILSRNEGRTLKDVASEVVATERTPRAEKTKQLFAMIWYAASSPIFSYSTFH